jgi:hypothetical protein
VSSSKLNLTAHLVIRPGADQTAVLYEAQAVAKRVGLFHTVFQVRACAAAPLLLLLPCLLLLLRVHHCCCCCCACCCCCWCTAAAAAAVPAVAAAGAPLLLLLLRLLPAVPDVPATAAAVAAAAAVLLLLPVLPLAPVPVRESRWQSLHARSNPRAATPHVGTATAWLLRGLRESGRSGLVCDGPSILGVAIIARAALHSSQSSPRVRAAMQSHNPRAIACGHRPYAGGCSPCALV